MQPLKHGDPAPVGQTGEGQRGKNSAPRPPGQVRGRGRQRRIRPRDLPARKKDRGDRRTMRLARPDRPGDRAGGRIRPPGRPASSEDKGGKTVPRLAAGKPKFAGSMEAAPPGPSETMQGEGATAGGADGGARWWGGFLGRCERPREPTQRSLRKTAILVMGCSPATAAPPWHCSDAAGGRLTPSGRIRRVGRAAAGGPRTTRPGDIRCSRRDAEKRFTRRWGPIARMSENVGRIPGRRPSARTETHAQAVGWRVDFRGGRRRFRRGRRRDRSRRHASRIAPDSRGPRRCKSGAGHMPLTAESRIVAGEEQLRPLAEVLSDEIAMLTGLKLKVATGPGPGGRHRAEDRQGDPGRRANPGAAQPRAGANHRRRHTPSPSIGKRSSRGSTTGRRRKAARRSCSCSARRTAAFGCPG